MKRLCIFLSAFLLFVLLGCTNIENSNLGEADITVFTTWLDNEGFLPAMSQSEIIEKMDGYTYNGQSVNDAAVGCHYDSPYGGGYTADGENFGFANDYMTSEDGKTADYANSFYTKVSLNGLTLPFGIEFEDALHDVLAKLGITANLPSNFTPDDGADVAMTLYNDERYTLVFKNLYLSKEPIAVDIPYELVFTENYTFTRESDRESNVTRAIKLKFAPNENVLHEFSVEIRENYKLK